MGSVGASMGSSTRWGWGLTALLFTGCAPVGLEWDPDWELAEAYAEDEVEEPDEPLNFDVPMPESRAWTGERDAPDGMWSHTDPGNLPSVRGPTGAELPLLHTDVDAELTGHIAQVSVVQTFRNDAEEPLEVTYRFPLPENAAVSQMRMVVDGRVIESRIMTREGARATYEQAKDDGHAAALLEQERRNIFTQSLANIPPGEEIDVEIEYVQTLSYDAGLYEFVFPMVIGPRYDGGKAADADRVMPSVVGKGMRRGDDFEIAVTARTGRTIDRWWVPTHDVDARVTDGALKVELQRADERINRDFVLRYGAAGSKARATMFLGPRDERHRGHFALVVHPPDLDVDTLVGRREFFFVIDRSGSMSGEPLALAKETLRRTLSHLRPVDTFEVVAFESGTQRLFGAPRPANSANLAQALRFLDGMRSGGGTEMGNAIEAALSDDVEKGRNRYVMLLTDGFISFEDQIIVAAKQLGGQIARRGQHARVFGVGMGDAPNDHLIRGVSQAGRGAALRVSNSTESFDSVQTFTRWVDHAIVDELKLHPKALELTELHPSDLGGLFASHAAIVHGEYRGNPQKAAPRLVGSTGQKTTEIPVRVVDASEQDTLLATLWAKAAVSDLEVEWWSTSSPEAKEQITRLGLAHNIVTGFTSLVAVDDSRAISDGDPAVVDIPTGWTTAVEASATSSRDSAGIALAGISSAETRYTVDGASVSNASFGSVGASIVQEYVEPGPREPDWEPRAWVTFGRPATPDGVAASAIRKPVKAVRYSLRRCYEDSRAFESDAHFDLPVVLKWDTDGVKIQIRNPALKNVRACMREVLSEVDWPKLPVGSTVTLPIRLSSH